MALIERKHLLLIVRRSPYGSSLARAALDVALATAAFEQPLSLLFLGDGVLHLMPAQDTQARGVKNLGRQLAAFPLYGIESVYVDAEACARFGLVPNESPVATLPLDQRAVGELLRKYDHVLGF